MAFQTRSQKDMALAASKIEADVIGKDFAGEYKRRCHQFPAFVLQCGLAQAVAFFAAKATDNDAYKTFLEHVAAVHNKNRADFVKEVREAQISEYMRLTRRTLDVTIFFKRFAEALIEDKEGA
jgi:CRISPR-associated protein Cmr5